MSATVKALPAATLPQIGQAFGGGFFAGITVENGQRYLNITASADHELKGTWGARGVIIEGAGSFTDSRSNTESMAAAGSELAQKVLALEIGGFTDWAIPARDVQELQYRHLKPTTEENYCWGGDCRQCLSCCGHGLSSFLGNKKGAYAPQCRIKNELLKD